MTGGNVLGVSERATVILLALYEGSGCLQITHGLRWRLPVGCSVWSLRGLRKGNRQVRTAGGRRRTQP